MKIKATVEPPSEPGGRHRFVHLEPDFAVLQHPSREGEKREVVWEFHNVPQDYTPTIVPVCFDPVADSDGQHHVFFKPFKDLIFNEGTITGEPYHSVAGICWYEIVLVPRRNAQDPERRLYCSTREMGGIDIEPPVGG